MSLTLMLCSQTHVNLETYVNDLEAEKHVIFQFLSS